MNNNATLIDASAYNIQFVGHKPVFIDILSIKEYEDGEYWSQPFQKLNTQITHVISDFELYVGGENLLDYKQESPILDSPESENFDASLIWAPTMGRFFYLGFRYKFRN